MTLLFTLSLSRHVAGMVKGPAKAAEQGIVGYYIGYYVDGKPYAPDAAAVRACLPACYRKAFDRTNGKFWFPKPDDGGPGFLSLCTARGRYLNTIYAQPYHFDPRS